MGVKQLREVAAAVEAVGLRKVTTAGKGRDLPAIRKDLREELLRLR